MRFLAIATLLASICFADTVVMKDGRKIEGAVTDLGDDYGIKGKFGTVKVKKADVESIEAAPAGDPSAKTKPFSGADRESLKSAEALLEPGKAVEALKSLAHLVEAAGTFDRDGQRQIWLLVSRLELRAGNRDRAAKAIATWAELSPSDARTSAQTRARLVSESTDGNYLVKEEDLTVIAGAKRDGIPPAGLQPLWDERVVAFALRVSALKELAEGEKQLAEARETEKKDKTVALRLYRGAEKAFARASEISTGCGRERQLEAVRGSLALLFAMGVEDDEKQMASSPLNVAFEMKANAEGRLRFTPAGRAKFDETKRDWNTQVDRLEAHVKEIDGLKARFPEEVAKQQALYDRLHTALSDMVPKIRAAFSKALQEHN